ncbi:MAG: hypothetical protein JSS53_06145 [Proteobacteria bacterium]|nr:hypothetical protein [Pseudomonadota bacterium]
MSRRLETFFENIMPFVIIGVSIALSILAIIVFAYVFIWGLIIGLLLFSVAYIKERFFTKHKPHEKTARIIEHDEIP